MTVVASPAWQGSTVRRTGKVAARVENLTKRFSVRRTLKEIVRAPFARKYAHALQSVTLDVAEGEFFGLLGPNGAGKTTLFKILATLVTPDQGTATVLGLDIQRDASAVRSILVPVVADERSLRWRLTARENLRLYAVLYGVPSDAVWTRVEEVLERVGLADTGTKLVGQFSSGMKQRLLIARALLASPRVLLLDEPTRGLDPISARKLRLFLRDEICHRHGCTVLLATHNTEEAFELCDRVAILDKGRVLVSGAADALALEYGEERYRLWTNMPDHPALATLVLRGLAEEASPGLPDADGWTAVELKIPGGRERAAQALEFLSAQQVSIWRFERAGLSLAELIERVQMRASEELNA